MPSSSSQFQTHTQRGVEGRGSQAGLGPNRGKPQGKPERLAWMAWRPHWPQVGPADKRGCQLNVGFGHRVNDPSAQARTSPCGEVTLRLSKRERGRTARGPLIGLAAHPGPIGGRPLPGPTDAHEGSTTSARSTNRLGARGRHQAGLQGVCYLPSCSQTAPSAGDPPQDQRQSYSQI